METEFKLDDVVEAFGVRGAVLFIDEENDFPLRVTLENGITLSFTADGRFDKWHKEPSLKLIKRPKRKVKKRFYMMAYKSPSDNYEWRVSCYLADDKFCNENGQEMEKTLERKIMENSPYIELDLEVSE